jgi:hypothetical protein
MIPCLLAGLLKRKSVSLFLLPGIFKQLDLFLNLLPFKSSSSQINPLVFELLLGMNIFQLLRKTSLKIGKLCFLSVHLGLLLLAIVYIIIILAKK